MENILSATIIVSVLGLVFGCLLGIASKIFKVERDERFDKIMNVLPGANCGGCGFAGCSQFADSVIKGEAECTGCTVGGASTALAVAQIMGTEAGEFKEKKAYVKCAGCLDVAKEKYSYNGIEDCFAASKILNGKKACEFGCLGLGSCVKVCINGAITIENGVAKINDEKCGGCGACIKACPKGLIQYVTEDNKYMVNCMNKEKGALLKNKCSVGCIGCGICMKNCPEGAITVKNFLAEIDPEKCTGCGICAEKCPKKVISLVKEV